MDRLDEILDEMAEKQFGMTLTKARTDKVCINCKQSIYDKDGFTANQELFFTPQGIREWTISALCEKCYDEAFS